jgi:predicted metal-dependent peptidase
MARKSKSRKSKSKLDPATKAFNEGVSQLNKHPLFEPLMHEAYIIRSEENLCPDKAWAVLTTLGHIHVHPKRLAKPENWVYVLAHCLLHLGFEHTKSIPLQNKEWIAACDYIVVRFLATLKLGQPPDGFIMPQADYPGDEEALFRLFCDTGIPLEIRHCGVATPEQPDIIKPEKTPLYYPQNKINWKELFAIGLTASVRQAVRTVAGVQDSFNQRGEQTTSAYRAREWFINNYPLLGSLAAAFSIIEERDICQRMKIRIAAIDAESKEIFVNPIAGLNEDEMRFVIAHELLHVGLRHDTRCQGRDPFLWNVACDYVINDWLIEMQIGSPPSMGLLHDSALKGLSAESIYDHITTDLRRYRKLATMRGIGLGDILGSPDWWQNGEGVDLDEFYRRCLMEGLEYHQSRRGLLPASLVEEINALSHPPIPWDVALAKWFDNYIEPLEKRRTYARPSRRQSSTPDIPRPRWAPFEDREEGRTFGVVLDTSGSMDRKLLAKALGAIASYSLYKEVPLVRVVFCDAYHYDQGYMAPEAIAGKVKVRGRGGTVLQPGIDLLERAEDFPKNGPILVITDGFCDRVRIRRDHAFLIPVGAQLPFTPKGKIFRMS